MTTMGDVTHALQTHNLANDGRLSGIKPAPFRSNVSSPHPSPTLTDNSEQSHLSFRFSDAQLPQQGTYSLLNA